MGSIRIEWSAVGRIVGPRLPDHPVVVGQVMIQPLCLVPPETIGRLPARLLPPATLSFEEEGTSAPPDYVVVSEPLTTISSRWMFVIELVAADVDEAEGVADQLLGDALAALHLVVGKRYTAQVLRLEMAPNGYNHSVWTTGHVEDPEELFPEDVAKANSLLPTLTSTSTAKTAEACIRKGAAMNHVSPALGGELGAFVLLNYFMAIERVADDVTKGIRKQLQEQIDRETDAAAGKLRQELGRQDLSNQDAIDLIREAAKEFSRIRFFFADLKIERAGLSLRLESSVVEEAKAFSRFRNEYLGHPRSEIPSGEFAHWFEDDRAFKLSNEFLRGYLDSLGAH